MCLCGFFVIYSILWYHWRIPLKTLTFYLVKKSFAHKHRTRNQNPSSNIIIIHATINKPIVLVIIVLACEYGVSFSLFLFPSFVRHHHFFSWCRDILLLFYFIFMITNVVSFFFFFALHSKCQKHWVNINLDVYNHLSKSQSRRWHLKVVDGKECALKNLCCAKIIQVFSNAYTLIIECP